MNDSQTSSKGTKLIGFPGVADMRGSLLLGAD